MVVLHYTAMSDAPAALARLCDPAFEVSAHWLVDRDGRRTSLVPEDRRAWHAGAGRWGDVLDVNSRSVGIELDNDGAAPFPEAQIDALIALLRGVLTRASGDPSGARAGPFRRGARRARSIRARCSPGATWPRRACRYGRTRPAPARRLEASLTRIGYDPDAPAADRLRAFRLRFRPGAAGGPDAEDAARAATIAARWPCGA